MTADRAVRRRPGRPKRGKRIDRSEQLGVVRQGAPQNGDLRGHHGLCISQGPRDYTL